MVKTYHQPILKHDADGNVLQESYLGDMAFRGEYTDTNIVYKGLARPGTAQDVANWQISFSQYDGDGNLVSTTWPEDANGAASSEFNFVWDDRATYTYS